jgi:hypothetical protein
LKEKRCLCASAEKFENISKCTWLGEIGKVTRLPPKSGSIPKPCKQGAKSTLLPKEIDKIIGIIEYQLKSIFVAL